MLTCDVVQAHLALESAADSTLDLAAVAEHLATCPHCQRFRAALEELDRTLPALPEESAPEALIQRVAGAVRDAPPMRRADAFGRPGWAAMAAGVLVAVSLFGLVDTLPEMNLMVGDYAVVAKSSPVSVGNLRVASQAAQSTEIFASDEIRDFARSPSILPRESESESETEAVDKKSKNREQPRNEVASEVVAPTSASSRERGDDAGGDEAAEDDARLNQLLRGRSSADVASSDIEFRKVLPEKLADLDRLDAPQSVQREFAQMAPEPEAPVVLNARVAGVFSVEEAQGESGKRDRKLAHGLSLMESETKQLSAKMVKKEASTGAKDGLYSMQDQEQALDLDSVSKGELQSVAPESTSVATMKSSMEFPAPASPSSFVEGNAGAGGLIGGDARLTNLPARDPHVAARRFLAERENLQGLSFEPASGYWSNTYVPGDPEMRRLAASLRGWDRSALIAGLGTVRFERAARPTWQPFDPPQGAALATYLHADKAAVSGPSRLRVQIGLKATERGSGLRPAMNVVLLLDAREPVSAGMEARMRALVLALARARQPGDQFNLVIAGRQTETALPDGRFRHGPLSLLLESALRVTGGASGRSLIPATRLATELAHQVEDDAAPLGASLILLVTGSSIAHEIEALEQLAHRNAVNGVLQSVVSIGPRPESAALDRLVLAGQGQRRVIAAAEEAERVIDEGLHAAGQAVARAVRLRLRLAGGVQLIQVLGAQRLAEPEAERVREAEQSIDQRISRNLGIEADRGEDEEGIQIVIPNFYSGDTHTVVLDVFVPGPGPIADLTVRYKDLVFLRNGVARNRLELPVGERPAGPLERNVLKNELAQVLAASAREAGRALASADLVGAIGHIDQARVLLAGLRQVVPGWATDPELVNDESMLAEYLLALRSPYMQQPEFRHPLAESLRFLSYQRLSGELE